jgi:uncharacterized damage-inducible protein DinB
MSTKLRQNLQVSPVEGFLPQIGRALWMLEDTRNQTGRILEGIAPEVIDWQPPNNGNSISTLLYHIAIIEMGWLFNEIMQKQMSAAVWEAFPFPVRDETGHLSYVKGVGLDAHFKRMDATRRQLLEVFKHMTLDDFQRARSFERYDVTPEWVIHHLVLHETEHRGEMATIRSLAEATV